MSSHDVLLPEALDLVHAGEAVLVDIREAYHRAGNELPEALHVPLGILLERPEAIPHERLVMLMGHDTAEADYAARYLRGFGYDAVPVAQPSG